MGRTWIFAYWAVATLAVFRLTGHSQARAVEPACGVKRTDYRVAILAFEWSKKVREMPVMPGECDGHSTGRADAPGGGER